jgi:YggT family protein
VAILWDVVSFLLFVFLLLLLARFVFEYVMIFARRWRPTGLVAAGLEVVYATTDPPLKAIRRLIPPLRLGNLSVDLGFMVLLFVVYILRGVAGDLANS